MPKRFVKKNRHIRLAVATIAILILIITAGQGVKITSGLFKPQIQNLQGNFLWEQNGSINLIIMSNYISILHLSPGEGRVFLLKIPAETYLEVPGGYGSWRADAIYNLGEAEQSFKGVNLLKSSVASFLGLPVDGFMQIEGRFKQKPHDEVIKEVKNPAFVFELISATRSDLSSVELAKIFWEMSKTRFDKIEILDSLALGFFERKKLLDGAEVLVPDPYKIDPFVEDNLSNASFREEQLTISVFNATSTPGLAKKAARVITNLGGSVVQISGYPDQKVKSIIFSKDEEMSKTYKKLARIFDIDCQGKICDILPEHLEADRAQIILILGEDAQSQYKW